VGPESPLGTACVLHCFLLNSSGHSAGLSSGRILALCSALADGRFLYDDRGCNLESFVDLLVDAASSISGVPPPSDRLKPSAIRTATVTLEDARPPSVFLPPEFHRQAGETITRLIVAW
jgi:hypothetical protein